MLQIVMKLQITRDIYLPKASQLNKFPTELQSFLEKMASDSAAPIMASNKKTHAKL
jgi:hypothetical protein